MVTILIMDASDSLTPALHQDDYLLRYPDRTGARIILLQTKSEKKHDRRPYGKDHKGIDVCQACRLCLQGLVNPGVRLYLCIVLARTLVGQMLSQAASGI